MSVRAPVEKNFRRAKARPSKRKTARRWVAWQAVRLCVILPLAVVAGYRAYRLVITASALQVRHVSVKGNVRLSVGEVQALVEDLKGTNIFEANLDEYRTRVMKSAWVAEVGLRRVLPSTIELFVSERRPIGLCRIGGELYLVDGTGTILDQFGPRYAEFDLPIIDGLLSKSDGGHESIDPRRAELAARVVDNVSQQPSLSRRVSQIDVSNLHDAVVLLDGDSARLKLGDRSFAERLQRYVEVAPRLREHVTDVDYVDLRFNRGIVVGQPAGAGRPARPAGPTKHF